VAADLLGALHAGAPAGVVARRPGSERVLVLLAFQPGLDHRHGHLDVALHAEMRADREGLVRAVVVLEDARGPRRDAEGLAVPVEGLECRKLAEPRARHGVVANAHLAPAHLAHGA